MTESYREKRLRELNANKSEVKANEESFRTRRLRDLQNYADPTGSRGGVRSLAPELFNPQAQVNAVDSFVERAKPPAPAPVKSVKDEWMDKKAAERAEKRKTMPKVLAKVDKFLEPATKAIDWAQANTPGVAAFQRGAGEALGVGDVVDRNAAPVTGSPIINAPARLAGGLAGLASVPGPNQLAAPFQAGKAISGTKAAQALTKGNVLGTKAIEGAVGGGLGGAAASVIAGQSDAKDVAKNAALGAGLGAVGDPLIAGVGKGMSKAAESLLKSQVSKVAGAIEEVANSSVKSGRLKVESNTEKLSRLMGDLKPVVDERMTPPLENPKELAKWLQPHLMASMNQIRKLSYEDLRQLAAEVQKGSSVMSVARQVAKERGVNLDALLDQTAPTFKQQADRLRLGGVAGAIEPPKNVKVALNRVAEPATAEVAATAEAPAARESWYTRLFGNNGVGVTPGRQGKELIDTQITRNAKEPISVLDKTKELTEQTNQDYIDRFAPFQKIDQDVYDAAMDSTKGNNLANTTIKDKMVDLEGNVIGDSLKDVYDVVPRGMKHISDRYVVARDAINRMDRNIQVYGKEKWFPQTSREAATLTANLEQQYPWLKQFGEKWNAFNRNRQDLWIQSGMASQRLIDTLRHTNPNYTPMFRQQPRLGLGRQMTLNTSKPGFGNQKLPIKRAVGSGRKIIEPAQGMIETTASSYNAMLRNRAMQELYKKVLADPGRFKGLVEIIEESPEAKKATINKLNDAINENGAEGIADMLNDEVNQLWNKAKQSGKTNDNTVTVMVNGEPQKMKVMEPSLLKAVDGLTPAQIEGFMKIADFTSRLVKQSATGLLAPLQGARLAVRDLPTAFAQSKDKARFLGDISHALVSQLGDWLPSFIPGSERLGKLAREYYRAGGGYEAYLKGDSRIRAAARDITKDPFMSGRNIAKQAVKYNPFRPLKELGDAFENIPRIAAYSAKMRKTGWNRSAENVRSALNDGREATVNWSRRGAKTQNLESIAPYTNSAIQGTYRLVKRFREQPVSATALIASLAAAKIYAYEKFKDDQDFKQRSKFETGIPVSKNADGKFVSIPVEPSDAYIADQVLNFYRWAIGEAEPLDTKEDIQKGIESFTPSILSGPISAFTTPNRTVDLKTAAIKTAGGTIFEPGIALSTGKNYFGGDIVPRELQEDPTQLQYDETTSTPAKWAAENLGIDAFTFDYLANKFGGDLAKIGLPTTSAVGKGDVEGNLIDQVNARVRLLEDPVMRNNISEDYYNRLKKVSDAAAISGRKETPLPSWYDSAYNDVTSMKKGSINKAVSELNAMKKEILRDTKLTAEERADKVRDVQRNINLLRIQGIKRLEELGVPK